MAAGEIEDLVQIELQLQIVAASVATGTAVSAQTAVNILLVDLGQAQAVGNYDEPGAMCLRRLPLAILLGSNSLRRD